jgi:hypothetical protein
LNGVPEKVIEAILSRSAPAASAEPAPQPAAPPAGSVAAVPPAMSPARARPTVFQVIGTKEVALMVG